MTDTPAEDAPETKSDSEKDEAKRRQNLVRAGIGIGIGSAAIAAALLYANKDKLIKKERPAPEPTD